MNRDGGALLCICGAVLSHETLRLAEDGADDLSIECSNPLCTLRRVAYIERTGGAMRLRLAKMIKEFNMLFMGYEEVERLEESISKQMEPSLSRHLSWRAAEK